MNTKCSLKKSIHDAFRMGGWGADKRSIKTPKSHQLNIPIKNDLFIVKKITNYFFKDILQNRNAMYNLAFKTYQLE